MQRVSSSNLSEVGYDKVSCTLIIKFHSGAVYEYYNVPENIYINLMKASSKGTYADQNIYKKYKQRGSAEFSY